MLKPWEIIMNDLLHPHENNTLMMHMLKATALLISSRLGGREKA
jgi:hypothetical protein